MEVAYDRLGRDPPFERDSLLYLKGNYWVSNEKLLDTGYELKYPGFREGVYETIQWYKDQGMI